MSKTLLLLALFFLTEVSLAQTIEQKIFTSDISNFWIAYDSVQSTQDTLKQKELIQALYVAKASQGLKDFIEKRGFTAEEWLKTIHSYPKFWKSIRPKTIEVLENQAEIREVYANFAKIYADFEPPFTYFVIGCLRTGGVGWKGELLIGTELAASNATVDASELNAFLQKRMKINIGVIYLLAHESVHTQQREIDDRQTNLLGKCLQEGSADFLAELLTKRPIEAPYMSYGLANEKQLREKFEKVMFNDELEDWLYNSRSIKEGEADLGYFMGYCICKKYFEKSSDKSKAIREIIHMDYSNKTATKQFLEQSTYMN